MNIENQIQHSNIAEEEMGQLHAIHLSMNGVAAIQARIGSGPSLFNCADCGDIIPEGRRLAVSGCKTCIVCANANEGRRQKL